MIILKHFLLLILVDVVTAYWSFFFEVLIIEEIHTEVHTGEMLWHLKFTSAKKKKNKQKNCVGGGGGINETKTAEYW